MTSKDIRIILTRGLQGSGKSFWAQEQQRKDPSLILVNKDELREMLFRSKFSRPNEKIVLKARDSIVQAALCGGRSVIVHDTNFEPKHEERMNEIADEWNHAAAAPERKAIVEVVEFDTPLDQCIENDLKRNRSVGEKVIRDTYLRYVSRVSSAHPTFSTARNEQLEDAILVDIDGTLAHGISRGPYEFEKCHEDLIDEIVRGIVVNEKDNHGTKIIVCSGRDSKWRAKTKQWLQDNHVPYDLLFMRPEGDGRKDCIVKEEILNQHIIDKYNIKYILEDRRQVVDMWRSHGLKVLHVDYGNF